MSDIKKELTLEHQQIFLLAWKVLANDCIFIYLQLFRKHINFHTTISNILA